MIWLKIWRRLPTAARRGNARIAAAAIRIAPFSVVVPRSVLATEISGVKTVNTPAIFPALRFFQISDGSYAAGRTGLFVMASNTKRSSCRILKY